MTVDSKDVVSLIITGASSLSFVLVLFPMHFYKYIKDLGPGGHDSRKDLFIHRHSVPKLTKDYRRISNATLCNLIFGLSYTVGESLSQLIITSDLSCRILMVVRVFSIFIEKYCIYYVFGYRLLSTYGSVSTNKWKLYVRGMIYVIGLFVVGFCMLYQLYFALYGKNILNMPKGTKLEGWYLEIDSNSFPKKCEIQGEAWYGILWVTTDFAINLHYIYLFTKPLRTLIKGNTKKDNELRNKLAKFSVKVTILSLCIIVSTFLSSIFYLAFLFNMWGFDMLLNCICLILMTDYYRDDTYYSNICCLCIKGFTCIGIIPKEHVILKNLENNFKDYDNKKDDSKDGNDNGSDDEKSIDTMSVPRIAGEEILLRKRASTSAASK